MKDDVQLDLAGLRAQKARLARRLGPQFFLVAVYGCGVSALGSFLLYMFGIAHLDAIAAAISILWLVIGLWYQGELRQLPPVAHAKNLTDLLSGEVLARLKPGKLLSPRSLWQRLATHGQAIFFTNHLGVAAGDIKQLLSDDPAAINDVWDEATRLADLTHSDSIEPGHLAGALLITSPEIQALLAKIKSSPNEVEHIMEWEGRLLELSHAPHPYFGGIGRDWANGFTPRLNQFGENVSLAIEHIGANYSWLMSSPGVQAMKSAFSQGVSAVALIGDPGVGKTSHVYALAQLLLGEASDPHLEHRQIISLNPSIILANSHGDGELEFTIMSLLQEAVHAGHIMLFFDDAQLFFKNDVGSLDITRVLLPIIQSGRVQLIFAMTPNDYQQLKATNGAFAGLLTPVMLSEPPEQDVMRVLEDTATGLEARHKVLVTYDALREAYRLSGRYDQDMAYPGKAIRLLDQSLAYAQKGVILSDAVQAAVEQSRGVKVGAAKPAEAEQLLHLEDAIHQRMINQSRAVSVVSNALRRARAGVSSPKRPIGSFLFLGPTGVGKTELAKSIAATYFGNEASMIRLDMSEYQQPSDVSRLLSNGAGEEASLIMAVRQQPFSVVLLDEIEKAHPNILNLLLQLLDEGQLTDTAGRTASFKDAIIIATSNAGANTIRSRVEQGEALETFEKEFIDELINSGQFKPELLNRFDEIVLFRPLNLDELLQVVNLMLADVNKTLANQNISVELTPAAAQEIIKAGYDPRLGARPLRRELQRTVEDTIAARILSGETKPGDHVVLDVDHLAHTTSQQ